jgi:hypothetical protein
MYDKQFMKLFVVLLLSFQLLAAHSNAAGQGTAPTKKPNPKTGSKPLKSKRNQKTIYNSYYLWLIASYQYQAERELQAGSDSVYTLSEFTGISPYISIGVDRPRDEKWALRGGLVIRRTHMTGSAVVKDTPTRYKFQLDQQFVGLEGGLRYRPSQNSTLSYLALFEVSKAMKTELKVLEGSAIDTTGIEKPFFFVMSAAATYEYLFVDKWHLEFGLKVGAIVTAEPPIALAEGLVGVKF